ncbi:hypothetical protein CRUP_016373 [Coryphaenoides rupestris]|nr:hypothetical protein CRUP_016373 [Coryphaenoides rupestris]
MSLSRLGTNAAVSDKKCSLDLEDIDECAQGKHYCRENTMCVNTAGSFMCICHTGFIRIDDYSCTGERPRPSPLHCTAPPPSSPLTGAAGVRWSGGKSCICIVES